MTYNEAVEDFILYISSYCSPATLEYYRVNLDFFSNYLFSKYGNLDFDVSLLSRIDYISYISYQRNRKVKNTSVRTYARSVKAFLRYLYNESIILENPTKNVKLPRSDKRIVIPLSSGDVENLDLQLKSTVFPLRNLCIFHLMLDCGLRLGEVIDLNNSDIDFCNSYITIKNSKCNKSRLVPLPPNLSCYIKRYISRERLANSCDNLILNSSCEPISKNSIEMLFSRLKTPTLNVYPHLLRHTFATSFILGGGSLEVLRVLLGHSSYNVTQEYLHIANYVGVANIDIYKIDECMFRAYNYRS